MGTAAHHRAKARYSLHRARDPTVAATGPPAPPRLCHWSRNRLAGPHPDSAIGAATGPPAPTRTLPLEPHRRRRPHWCRPAATASASW